MVVVLKHRLIPRFLRIMNYFFKKYELIFNSTKSAIIKIKNHNKINIPSEKLLNIPIE